MASKMQYLISMSDDTIEKVIQLENLWGIERNMVIQQAVDYLYQSNDKPVRGVELMTDTASNIAVAIVKQSLEEGYAIKIPSLGITIEPTEKKYE